MWREIKGYEGLYEMSEDGKVRRLEGIQASGRHISEHLITTYGTKNRMKYVCLWREGSRKNYMLHKLYATTWDVTENDAVSRVYHGFRGSQTAPVVVRDMLQRNIAACREDEAAGADRHDEILYLEGFLAEMENGEKRYVNRRSKTSGTGRKKGAKRSKGKRGH